MKDILKDRDGHNSSKRIIGFSLVSFGLIGKTIIFYLGCKASELMINFPNLDGSTNDLIYAGSALVGVSVFEFLGKKK